MSQMPSAQEVHESGPSAGPCKLISTSILNHERDSVLSASQTLGLQTTNETREESNENGTDTNVESRHHVEHVHWPAIILLLNPCYHRQRNPTDLC
jgi:hypothetical protein